MSVTADHPHSMHRHADARLVDALPAEGRTRDSSARSGIRAVVDAYAELAKLRLNLLVLLTTAVGFAMAGDRMDWPRLAWTLFGTALAAFGANALNQCIEAPRDALMHRTRGRPLPSSRISPRAALRFAMLASMSGPIVLAFGVHPLPAALALGCLSLYVLVYTPLKLRTVHNTLIGAVCGAMPPLIGSTAAAGRFEFAGMTLAAILFIWQIPHFLALAWMYREDYRRGGFRMLSVTDPSGHATAWASVFYSAALLPVALLPAIGNLAGPLFAVGAMLLGALLLVMSLRFMRLRDDSAARRLFLASVIHLPLLLGLLVLDRAPDRKGRIPTVPPDGVSLLASAGIGVDGSASSPAVPLSSEG